MRVACVGAGPAGLTLALALALRAPEHEVRVLERREIGAGDGFGVVFWDDLLETLHGIDPVVAERVAAAAYRWHDQVLRVDGGPELRSRAHGYGLDRRVLIELLAERARELGVALEAGRGAVADGEELRLADLVVACDGAGSALRAGAADSLGARVAAGRNDYAWLGLDRPLGSFTFALRRAAGHLAWIHAYGCSPAGSTVVVECAPETCAALGLRDAPAAEALAALERLFAGDLEGGRLLSRARAGEPLPWQRFRTVTCARWRAGRLVLAGDAAHTAHFSIGSGTRLAVEDAAALARCLARVAPRAAAHAPARPGAAPGPDALADALAAYERERRPAVLRAQQDARRSARYFERLDRYARLDPERLFRTLLERRSRVLPLLPAAAYCAVGELRERHRRPPAAQPA